MRKRNPGNPYSLKLFLPSFDLNTVGLDQRNLFPMVILNSSSSAPIASFCIEMIIFCQNSFPISKRASPLCECQNSMWMVVVLPIRKSKLMIHKHESQITGTTIMIHCLLIHTHCYWYLIVSSQRELLNKSIVNSQQGRILIHPKLIVFRSGLIEFRVALLFPTTIYEIM